MIWREISRHIFCITVRIRTSNIPRSPLKVQGWRPNSHKKTMKTDPLSLNEPQSDISSETRPFPSRLTIDHHQSWCATIAAAAAQRDNDGALLRHFPPSFWHASRSPYRSPMRSGVPATPHFRQGFMTVAFRQWRAKPDMADIATIQLNLASGFRATFGQCRNTVLAHVDTYEVHTRQCSNRAIPMLCLNTEHAFAMQKHGRSQGRS